MVAGRAAPQSVLDLIGNTPVVPLRRVAEGVPYTVLAKLEFLNPGGSVKDRIGVAMVDDAEQRGLLKPGGTVVEATSGNTGVGLALVAAVRGYRSVIVMPDKMSSEKIRMLRAFGARVVITPSQVPPEHPMSVYSVARRLAGEIPGAYYPNQYDNDANPLAHYRTTGPEIDRNGGARLGAVIATVGTGGTLSGIGRYFKERRPEVKIVAVDPVGSVLGPYFRTRKVPPAVPYLVEGIGEDKVPKSIHYQYIDEFVDVEDGESFAMARRLAREEGLFVGGSSGSVVVGALRWLAARPLAEGATVVVILPDSGDRYLSRFYSEEWMREKGFFPPGATAGDLIARRRGDVPPLVTVDRTARVGDALAELHRYGISQMPVTDAGKIVGSILEEAVLRRTLEDETVSERTVASVLQPPFAEIGAGTPIATVLHRLKEERALLVREEGTGRAVGLVTRNDVLGYLSESGVGHAL